MSFLEKTGSKSNEGCRRHLAIETEGEPPNMEEKNMPRRPRRNAEDQPKNESLVYGKNPVTELLKSGSGVDTVLIAEGMAPAVAAYYTAMAKEAGAAVKRVNPNKLRLMTGTESHREWPRLPVRSNTSAWRICCASPRRRASRPSSSSATASRIPTIWAR